MRSSFFQNFIVRVESRCTYTGHASKSSFMMRKASSISHRPLFTRMISSTSASRFVQTAWKPSNLDSFGLTEANVRYHAQAISHWPATPLLRQAPQVVFLNYIGYRCLLPDQKDEQPLLAAPGLRKEFPGVLHCSA